MTLYPNTKGFTRLKLSILGFGIFTLPEIIIMLFQFAFSLQVETILDYDFLSTIQVVCFVIVIFGFLILTLGLYFFSRDHEKEMEVKVLAVLFLIFFILLLLINIFGFFLSLIIGDFHMVSTLMDIANMYSSNNKYRDLARIWALFSVILFFYLLILMLKFTTWFNDIAKANSSRGTYLMVLSSGFYFCAAIFSLISISILFPPINFYAVHPLDRITDLDSIMRIIPLEDVVEAQLLSYFLILLGLITQFTVSFKLYLNLNNMSSIDSK